MAYYGPVGARPFYLISLEFASALPQSYTLTLVHASVRICYLCILFYVNYDS